MKFQDNTGNAYYSKGAVQRMSNARQSNWYWEPQRTNNFEVQIELDNLGLPKLSDTGSNQGYKKDLMLSVANFDAPGMSISPIEVPYGNNIAKFAGRPSMDTSNITFNDFIGLDVERLLAAWFNLIYDPKKEVVGQAKDYKTTAYLIEFSPDGKIYRSWTLHGVWLGEYKLGSFAQDNNAVRQISGSLIYDYFTETEKSELKL